MNLDHARAVAQVLMLKHGLEGWTFAFDRAKRRAGQCNYQHRRISLSEHFAERNSAEEVIETVLHEIAHAKAGSEAGHGPLWVEACAMVGARPVRCYGADVDMPKGEWAATCPCGRTFRKHRRPRTARICPRCMADLQWSKV